MGLFGKLFDKKKEEAPVQHSDGEKSAAYKAFAADFLHEELSILAVTGLTPLTGGELPGSGLKVAGTQLVAWMDADTFQLSLDPIQLVVIGDDALIALLRSRLPQNFILKFKARLSVDGKRLLLLNLPEPGFDPDLKAIVEERKKPVTLEAEGLGTFTLNRMYNAFQAEVDWLGTPILLNFSQEEDQAACLQTGRVLMADQALWDEKVRACAAEKMLDCVNELLRAGENDDMEDLTAQELMERMELETVEVLSADAFRFWFHDCELLWNGMQISGTLSQGATDAAMEG